MKRYNSVCVLLALACAGCVTPGEQASTPASVKSTRQGSYEWTCKDPAGALLKGSASQDAVFEICANAALATPGAVFDMQGAHYTIVGSNSVPPSPESDCSETPQPADDTRTQTCPAGSSGTWTQTRAYTNAAYPACWSAGEWTPSSAPAGACTATPTGGLPTPEITGYKHTGVTLTNYTGPTTITTAGTVIDSKKFTQELTIKANNVTIKRSLMAVSTSSERGPLMIDGNRSGLLIEDVEITSGPSGQCDRTIVAHGDATSSAVNVFRRVYAHGCFRGMDITGGSYGRFEDSYHCCNSNPGSGERAHASAIRAAGGVHHWWFNNTVLGVGAGSWASGVVATYPENGANGPLWFNGGLWVIEGNNDGAYGIAAGHSSPEPTNHDYTVEGLQISTQYYAQGCPSGCAQQWNELTGTNVWSNVTKYNPGKSDHGQPIGAGTLSVEPEGLEWYTPTTGDNRGRREYRPRKPH